MKNIDLCCDPYAICLYEWIILAVLFAALLIQIFYYLYYYRGILALEKKKLNAEVPHLEILPSVSVIICAKDESENLRKNLKYVLEQKYEPGFEVIVVNDGSTDETDDVIYSYEKQYGNLRHTFIPENAKIVSRKKLALTIGIKAARHDILLLTDADCRPCTENWIETIARNFTPQKEFVLGYGAYEKKKGILSHLISYDTLFIALQYMGFAIRGVPYMGVGRNMAYRKEMFFNNKGFASTLHLQSGDDDLFVNAYASRRNTTVETDKESVTVSTPKASFYEWYIQKERHLSTSPHYSADSRIRIGIEVFSRFFFYLTLILALVLSPLLIKLICVGIYLFRLITQWIIINKSASILGERHFYLSVVFFDVFLPVVSLYGMFTNATHKSKIYRWK